MEQRFTFTRNERLKSEKRIGALFREGRSYLAYPVKVVWMESPPSPALSLDAAAPRVQVAISTPKRAFKGAVERNLLKRRMREAYRLHKHALYEKLQTGNQTISMMLVYIAKEPLSFAEIENGIKKMIRKFPG